MSPCLLEVASEVALPLVQQMMSPQLLQSPMFRLANHASNNKLLQPLATIVYSISRYLIAMVRRNSSFMLPKSERIQTRPSQHRKSEWASNIEVKYFTISSIDIESLCSIGAIMPQPSLQTPMAPFKEQKRMPSAGIEPVIDQSSTRLCNGREIRTNDLVIPVLSTEYLILVTRCLRSAMIEMM